MPEQEQNDSRLRFEIRDSEEGPYFALVFTSNGQSLMKSEAYRGSDATAMRNIEHAIERARREALGAAEENLRGKGNIGKPAPRDDD